MKLSIIDLNTVPKRQNILSCPLLEKMEDTLKKGEKVLLFLNQKGRANAYCCQDCHWISRCPYCQSAFRVIEYPERSLYCFSCGYTDPLPNICPSCKGSHHTLIGSGNQDIEKSLKTLFPKYSILRIDSNTYSASIKFAKQIQNTDIVISTHMLRSLDLDHMNLVGFLWFEQEFFSGEHDVQEHLSAYVFYQITKNIPVFIQTYIPQFPLLQHLISGNYGNVLSHLLQERKKWSYPPYAQISTLFCKKREKQDVVFKTGQLFQKLQDFQQEEKKNFGDIQTFYDPNNVVRQKEMYIQKIFLHGKNIHKFLTPIKKEIFLNSGIWVEWG